MYAITRIFSAAIISFFVCFHVIPCIASPSAFNSQDIAVIKQYLLANIATDNHSFVKLENGKKIYSQNGSVLASPSNKGDHFSQDYQFHWTRDAALTMREVTHWYETGDAAQKTFLKPYLLNYVFFEKEAQTQQSLPGEETLGQPKFNMDATIWEGAWGRPQNDGPALRAITLMAIREQFKAEPSLQTIDGYILQMVKTDLDYVVSHWQQSSFDLWEEVNDPDHFYTQMVQRKALHEGATLFPGTKDALLYDAAANEITARLKQHWQPQLGFYSETINQLNNKGGGLNSAIILAVLHGELDNANDDFALTNDHVISSIYAIRKAFALHYDINRQHASLPPLIGRYPSDIYDGDQFQGGNPWVLTTNALAQYYYALAARYERLGVIAITSQTLPFFEDLNRDLFGGHPETINATKQPKRFQQILEALMTEGDRYLQRIKSYGVCYHAGDCLHFAEQIDRSSGEQTSAKDLTWGYASILTALDERELITMGGSSG